MSNDVILHIVSRVLNINVAQSVLSTFLMGFEAISFDKEALYTRHKSQASLRGWVNRMYMQFTKILLTDL